MAGEKKPLPFKGGGVWLSGGAFGSSEDRGDCGRRSEIGLVWTSFSGDRVIVATAEGSADGSGRGWSGLWSFGGHVWYSSSQDPKPWTSGRGFESHQWFGVGVAARSRQVPRPGLTEIDPRGPVLLGVCVCVCLWAPSVK